MKYVFGPVPSRRLGRSLGVNNLPTKYCTYSCIYCQIGRTKYLTIKRREFFDPKEILSEVVKACEKLNYNVDYVTIVPNGEPTLDANLGKLARLLKQNINLPLAILTNASLIFRDDVRNDLAEFDLVSLKIDAVSSSIWKRINRPHKRLDLDKILEGILEFSRSYKGTLITETMLIKSINDDIRELRNIATFLREVNPNKIYLAIPTRPPCESWVKPASEAFLVKAYEEFRFIFKGKVELLISSERGEFVSVKNPIQDFLSIVSVHPMREDYARKFFKEYNLDAEKILQDLLERGLIVKVRYSNTYFFLRKYYS